LQRLAAASERLQRAHSREIYLISPRCLPPSSTC
jgi:hypothetical protein